MKVASIVLSLGLLLGAAVVPRDRGPSVDREASREHRTSAALRKSLVIIVDGLRPDALHAAGAQHIESLIDGTFAPGYRGAYSPSAQAEEVTLSGPGHSSILTGVHLGKHGVASNAFDAKAGTFSGARYERYRDYFAVIEAARPELHTVRLVTWDATHSIPSGAGKAMLLKDDDAALALTAARILAGTHPDYPEDPDALFVFFSDTDNAGHQHGFSPARRGYLDAIRKVDEQIGSILSALKSRPDFAREDWQIVLTSDHGGAPDGRHDGGTPEKRTVPFLVTSRIATQGLMGGRPEIVDVAPTVLAHMGSTAPAVYDGRAQGCLHVVASGSQSGKAGRNRGERQPAGTTGKSSKGFENSPNRTDVYDSPPAGQRASIRFRPTEPPYIIPC